MWKWYDCLVVLRRGAGPVQSLVMLAVLLTALVLTIAVHDVRADSSESIEFDVPLDKGEYADRLWVTVYANPVTFKGERPDLPGSTAEVRSGTLSVFYRYEPDWTDVELRFSVLTLSGRELFSEPWYGARHPQATKWDRRYDISIPEEVLEDWVSGDEPIGVTLKRKYIGGGRNSSHPLVFGGPGGDDEIRIKLTMDVVFTGNAAPSAPTVTTIPSTRPVAGNVLLEWTHDEPRDFNPGDKVFYEVQTSLDGGAWQSLKGGSKISGDARNVEIPVPSAPGSRLKMRLRAVDSGNAASAWVEVPGAYTVAENDNAGFRMFLESPLRKIKRFSEPAYPKRSPRWMAAGGEVESIQLVVTSASAHKAMEVDLGSLRSDDGSRIPEERVVVYRQEYMDIVKPSRNVGQTGWWPDALVPLVDPYYGEVRRKRPMNLNAGENESFWIEVSVPPGQKPGIYRSNLTVSMEGQESQTIPLALEVLPFGLPVQPTLRTAFGFDPSNVSEKGMYSLCKKEAAKHRIAFYTGFFTITGDYDAATDSCTLSTNQTKRFFGDALSGDGMPDGRRFTSINVTGSPDIKTDEAWIAYWRAVQEFLESKGWLEKSYVYVWDEPKKRHMADVEKKCRLIKQGAPKLKTLVTTECRPALRGLVDIWCPVINFFDKEDRHGGAELYRSRQAKGEEVWWYSSMMSEETVKLPSYFIDAGAVSPRIVGALSWLRDIEGVLYYQMGYKWGKQPWVTQYAFHANGDGTLWYPGKPELIGGTKGVPIPSIRLNSIRDGFEDYEYLALLERLGGGEEGRAIITEAARDEYDWSTDPEDLIVAREKLAGAIMDRMQ